MIAALLYLQYHTFRNRLVSRFKRLKQPKYLIGAIVGGLYFYFYFFRYLFRGFGGRPAVDMTVSPEHLQLFELLGALALFVIVLLAWIIPHERAALTFTEAEVAFLFPAPITRRALIHFKLLRSQFGILFTTLLFTLFSRRFGGNAWIHAFGWWLLLSTLQPSLPRLLIRPDDAAGSRHFQPAPAAAGLRGSGGDGRLRLGLGKTNTAGTGSRRHRQSQCDSGLRATGFDRRPGGQNPLRVIQNRGRLAVFVLPKPKRSRPSPPLPRRPAAAGAGWKCRDPAACVRGKEVKVQRREKQPPAECVNPGAA